MRQELKIGTYLEDPLAEPLQESLKKVNDNFIELYETDLVQSNTVNFKKAGSGSQFGLASAPRTGTLILDSVEAVIGGCAVIYFSGSSLVFDKPIFFQSGTLDEEGINLVWIWRDAEGNFIVNIQSRASGSVGDTIRPAKMTINSVANKDQSPPAKMTINSIT